MPIFDIGFEPQKPSPNDVSSIGVRVAGATGAAQGLTEKIAAPINAAIVGGQQVAGMIGDKLSDAVYGNVGVAQQNAAALAGHVLQQVGLSLAGPVQYGATIGLDVNSLPSMAAQAKAAPKAKRGRKKKASDEGASIPPAQCPEVPDLSTLPDSWYLIYDPVGKAPYFASQAQALPYLQRGWTVLATASTLKQATREQFVAYWRALCSGSVADTSGGSVSAPPAGMPPLDSSAGALPGLPESGFRSAEGTAPSLPPLSGAVPSLPLPKLPPPGGLPKRQMPFPAPGMPLPGVPGAQEGGLPTLPPIGPPAQSGGDGSGLPSSSGQPSPSSPYGSLPSLPTEGPITYDPSGNPPPPEAPSPGGGGLPPLPPLPPSPAPAPLPPGDSSPVSTRLTPVAGGGTQAQCPCCASPVTVYVYPPGVSGTAQPGVRLERFGFTAEDLSPGAASPGDKGQQARGLPGVAEFERAVNAGELGAMPPRGASVSYNDPPAHPVSKEKFACLPNGEALSELSQRSFREWLEHYRIIDTRGSIGSWREYAGELSQRAAHDEEIARQRSSAVDKWSGVAIAWLKEFLAETLRLSADVTGGLISWAEKGATELAKASGCSDGSVVLPMMLRFVVGAVERWIGEVPPELIRAIEYWTSTLCPNGIPNQIQADSAWLHNTISSEQWECITKANGNRVDLAKAVRDADRSIPSINDLISLSRRGMLNDATFESLARRAGITSKEDLQLFWEASRWVASPSDAVNWMLKDVEDEQIQGRFRLKEEFERKYTKHVKEVFDANGISERDAEYIWRAHWRNMSPTTLYQMLHRLRSDKSGSTRIGDKDVSWKDIATNADDVFEALGQADYPPYWRDRLMAISYSMMTRVDIRRAFETNQLSPDEMVSQLRDRGYTIDDAKRLYNFYREAHIQLSMRRPAANAWVKVGYDSELCKQQLQDQGMREDEWPEVFRRLQTRRKALVQTNCLAAIHKAYDMRLIEDSEAVARMISVGINLASANDLINDWRCQRSANHKNISVGAIKDLIQTGIIASPTEAKGKLRELGYRPRDIKRLLSLWWQETPKRSVIGVQPAILDTPTRLAPQNEQPGVDKG